MPVKSLPSASALIDQRIRDLDDWRGKKLQRMRQLIHMVEPQVVEEWKWRGVPVWSYAGGICTGESYKQSIKLTFHHGASLSDPARLFTSSLQGNTRRAIDILEQSEVDETAFKALVKAAVAFNFHKRSLKARPTTKKSGSPPGRGPKSASKLRQRS